MACRIVRMMEGRVDWAAVPVLAAWLGVDDADTLFPLIELVAERSRPKAPGFAEI